MDILNVMFETKPDDNVWRHAENPCYPTEEILERTKNMTEEKCKYFIPRYRECRIDFSYCLGIENCPKHDKNVALTKEYMGRYHDVLVEMRALYEYYPSKTMLREHNISNLENYAKKHGLSLVDIYKHYGFKDLLIDGMRFKFHSSLDTYIEYRQEIVDTIKNSYTPISVSRAMQLYEKNVNPSSRNYFNSNPYRTKMMIEAIEKELGIEE